MRQAQVMLVLFGARGWGGISKFLKVVLLPPEYCAAWAKNEKPYEAPVDSSLARLVLVLVTQSQIGGSTGARRPYLGHFPPARLPLASEQPAGLAELFTEFMGQVVASSFWGCTSDSCPQKTK